MQLIAQDKKVKRGKLTFVLARCIGEAFVADDVDAVRGARVPGGTARINSSEGFPLELFGDLDAPFSASAKMATVDLIIVLAVVLCLWFRPCFPEAKQR